VTRYHVVFLTYGDSKQNINEWGEWCDDLEYARKIMRIKMDAKMCDDKEKGTGVFIIHDKAGHIYEMMQN